MTKPDKHLTLEDYAERILKPAAEKYQREHPEWAYDPPMPAIDRFHFGIYIAFVLGVVIGATYVALSF